MQARRRGALEVLPVEVARQPRLQQVALGRAQREAAPQAPPEVQQAHRARPVHAQVVSVDVAVHFAG